MRLYWRERNKGFDLCVEEDDGNKLSVGGVRETKRGIEALAKTMGYDPGRAIKGLNNFEEGRAFVEQFEPWRDFYPGEPLELESEIAPLPEKAE